MLGFALYSFFKILKHIIVFVDLAATKDRLVLNGQDQPIFKLLQAVPNFSSYFLLAHNNYKRVHSVQEWE